MKELAEDGGAFAMLLMEDGQKYINSWKLLHNPEVVGNLNMEEYLDLCLDAGYSQEASQRAAKDWGLKRLRKGVEL
jgi:hypothetical protein